MVGHGERRAEGKATLGRRAAPANGCARGGYSTGLAASAAEKTVGAGQEGSDGRRRALFLALGVGAAALARDDLELLARDDLAAGGRKIERSARSSTDRGWEVTRGTHPEPDELVSIFIVGFFRMNVQTSSRWR